MKEKRYRIVKVSGPLLAGMLIQDAEIHARCVTGIPIDAKLIGVALHTQFDADVIALKFEHPSFDPVLESETIPVAAVKFERIDCKAAHDA